VPPLAAVFAKLFLLQGIAFAYDSKSNPDNMRKGRERIDQAYQLLQCLRMLAPEDAVQTLLEVTGSGNAEVAAYATSDDMDRHDYDAAFVTRMECSRSDAIAALRKSRGDVDAAANALSQGATERRKAQHDREVQYMHGLCDNEVDPINLTQVGLLKPMLGYGDTSAENNLVEASTNDLAVGLLRLANNELSRALEIYMDQGYDAVKVQQLVDSLDQRLVQRGLMGRATLARKKRRMLQPNASRRQQRLVVDEIALVQLLSMGVDETTARRVLQKSANDVEKATLMLFSSEEREEGVPATTSSGHVGDPLKHSERTSPSLRMRSFDTKTEHDANQTAPCGGDNETQEDEEEEEAAPSAEELLLEELGDILEERDLEKEYLGSSLEEEWQLALKYRGGDK